MRQLCAHLDLLTTAEMRTAAELAIDTGRRPEEIAALAFDYLARDADGCSPPTGATLTAARRSLMDHRKLDTTRQRSVREQRRREAVDRVATMQFDRHGNRIWRDAKALLDSEHVRRSVGETAVPFGVWGRAVQRQGGRERLPLPVPLRGLRPLPHRRVLPPGPARLSR